VAEVQRELQQTRHEVKRLVRNWQQLLDVMPEMVMLIRDDYVIEYMNRSALEKFGDLCAEYCGDELRAELDERLFRGKAARLLSGSPGALKEMVFHGVPVEFSVAPFEGYRGDHLVMVVMRDNSQRKAHEQEIAQFHANIEHILQQKIEELKESEKLRRQLSQQVNSLKHQLSCRNKAEKIIGSSRKMQELKEMIFQVAKTDTTVLITGESGTGKELVANLLREASDRADKPFLKINCNTINDSILESDLFGYEKGAFTGATARKKGKFEMVDGGTIFLDEIGDISPRMQASLLRVLQNNEIIRVGGTEPVRVDVRVIAATNVDLAQAVQEKKFRLDLYYRLNIIRIDIPPLRERKEDIVELVSYFVSRYREAFKKDIDFVPQSVINRLLLHDWPGNVRELENVIQRAVLMAKGNMITEQDICFVEGLAEDKPAMMAAPAMTCAMPLGEATLKDMVGEYERGVIEQALRQCQANVAEAAKMLAVGKTALYDKMKRYGISAKAIKRELASG